MSTQNITAITTAAAAKEAAAKAAAAQQAANELQAAANAAQLEIDRRTKAAATEYYEHFLETYSSKAAELGQAVKDAESAFKEAVLTGSESGAAYLVMMGSRSDLYVLNQERIRSLEKLQGGRDVKDRTIPPYTNSNFKYFEEVNRILEGRVREITFEAGHDMADRRSAFISERVNR